MNITGDKVIYLLLYMIYLLDASNLLIT